MNKEFLQKLRDVEAQEWELHTKQIGNLRKIRSHIRSKLMFLPPGRELLNITNRLIEREKELKQQKERLIDDLDRALDE